MREVLHEGDEILFDGAPAAHLEPLDDNARRAVAMVEADGGFGDLDPVRHLSLTMAPDVARDMAEDRLNQQAAEIAVLKAKIAQYETPLAAAPPAPPAPPVVQHRAPPPPPPPLAPRRT